MSDLIKILCITEMNIKTRLIKNESFWITSGSTRDITSSLLKGPVYKPTKGDRIWFYPGCNVPRFKVKQFCQKNDVAVVKYEAKANVKFIGTEAVDSFFTNRGMYTILKVEFLKWFDTIMCNSYMELRALVVAELHDYIYLSSSVRSAFVNEDTFHVPLDDELCDCNCEKILSEESYQNLLKIQNDPTIKSQNDILSLLNTGVILDEGMYKNIHSLFESSDKENTKLAMEAMANCDFQKSAVYLLLLMKEYGDKISDSGNRHHVNFKSLIKYFQVSNLENMSVDDMIDSLRVQKLLNVDNLNRLMPLAMERLREKGDMNNIKIKDVELSEEAELSIAENILDQQITPPAPESSETPEPSLFEEVKEPFNL